MMLFAKVLVVGSFVFSTLKFDEESPLDHMPQWHGEMPNKLLLVTLEFFQHCVQRFCIVGCIVQARRAELSKESTIHYVVIDLVGSHNIIYLSLISLAYF